MFDRHHSGLLTFALCLASSWLPAQRGPDLYDDTVVRRVDLTFNDPGYWLKLHINYPTRQYMKADLTIDGMLFKDVGVRFRGNASFFGVPATSLKRPFKISIDEFIPDKKLYGYKTLNFVNNFSDPSWLRDITAYRIFRKYMPAPRCCYIHLFVNGQDFGPYFNTQQINKAMLAEWFESEDGNRYRGKRPNLAQNIANTALTWLGRLPPPYKAGFVPKLKNAPDPWTDLIKVCDVLNNTPSAALYDKLPAVLDVDSAIWMHANATALIWLDSYIGVTCHNFYICGDEANGRMVMMPWDTNNAFGTYTDGQAKVLQLSPFYNEQHKARPLFTRIVANPRWRQRYLAHIRSIRDLSMEWSRLKPWIDAHRRRIDALVKNDPQDLYGYQKFVDNATKDVTLTFGPNKFLIPGIQTFFEGRAAYLRADKEVNQIAPSITDLRRSPVNPNANQDVWITARVTSKVAIGDAHIYWRRRGAYTEQPMFDDGKHRDGAARDGVYGSRIPAQKGGAKVEYYASAQSTAADANAMTFLPRTASNRPPHYVVAHPRRASSLKINEFMARNKSTIRDEKGEYEDWVEIVNTSNQSLPIGGVYLTDKLSNPKKWLFPPTTIPAGGHVLVWCDDEAAEGPLHATFKMDARGEWLGLFAPDGKTLLDEIVFGRQMADVSGGRLRDGGATLVSFLTPSPRAPNVMICGTRRFDSFNPSIHRYDLDLTGTPSVGQTMRMELRNGPKNGLALVFLALAGGHIQLQPRIVALLGGPKIYGPNAVRTNPNGAFTLPVRLPSSASAVGVSVVAQVAGTDAAGASASNAVHVIVCK